MKTISILSLIVICFTSGAMAQCNNEELVTASVSTLTPGYSFLKSYKINGEKDLEKVEFSYVLTKGTQYMLNLKDRSTAVTTIVTLYDAKRNKVASNKLSGGIAGAIAFSCGATGIYYMTYTFESASERCAASALGFKR
ncbi:MAG TPA: hypothetical protein VFE50_04505 [Cyclobacteriaceae bacterium]|nr:hypothetical protein [Cyclobacteriaceae bacterium]